MKDRTPRLPGLGSYKGRFLWIGSLIIIGLFSTAYLGHQNVRHSSTRSTQALENRASIGAGLYDTTQSLFQLTDRLALFARDPQETPASKLRQTKKALDSTLRRLINLIADYRSPAIAILPSQLTADSAALDPLLEELIQVRLDTGLWLPAGRVMRESMLPANQAIRTHIQNLLSMAVDTDDAELIRQIQAVRYHWISATNENRLLVANRFGVFDIDAQQAMRTRIDNIRAQLDAFQHALENTRTHAAHLHDAFLDDEVQQIGNFYGQWLGGYLQLRQALQQDDWRRDHTLLKKQILPITARMQQRLSAANLQLRTDGIQGLNTVLKDNARLADAITNTAGVLSILILLGYFGFLRGILQPITSLAKQMQREARGARPEPLAMPRVSETRNLIEAFNNMHQHVTDRQQQLDHLAHHDPLTGLPNRVLFRKQLTLALRKNLPMGESVAVLFLDLDRFKQINDTHGHLVGDQLLVEIARRLLSVFRSEDTVARLSGDEFAVLLPDAGGQAEQAQMANKILHVLEPAIEIHGEHYHSSCSVGIAVAPKDGLKADLLIQHADAAMYHAKESGRAAYAHFDPSMVATSAHRLAMDTQLHEAIQQQQLAVYLQPVVNLDNGDIHAHECLLRWQHPEQGLLSPGSFLADLDDYRLLRLITDWLLDEVAQALHRHPITVSVNLPARLLLHEDFGSSLHQRLKTGQLPPGRLIVEITEDTLTQDLENAAMRLNALRQLGVRLALDDFGTGQSSLNHLRALSFDLLKIDRSFVQGSIRNAHDAALVEAILSLSRALDVKVVGEGVESPEQLEFLKRHHCTYGQGYLLGTPVPLEQAAPARKVQQSAEA